MSAHPFCAATSTPLPDKATPPLTQHTPSQPLLHVHNIKGRGCIIAQNLSGNGDLDLNSGLERDRGDLLDDLGRRGKVDEALVDAHLEAVPGLGTLTTGPGALVTVTKAWASQRGLVRSARARVPAWGPSGRAPARAPFGRRRSRYSRLAGGVLEVLGGEADGALDLEVAVLGAVDEVGRD